MGMIENPIDRFSRKYTVNPVTDCWEWTGGTKDADGYGKFWYKNRTLGAHRWIYEHTHGPIAAGLCVCHKCDNPSCVNPSHLFLDTNVGNTKDRHQKGRSVRGSAVGTSTLTEADVRYIKQNLLSTCTLKEIADRYGVSTTAIHSIRSNKGWRHV